MEGYGSASQVLRLHGMVVYSRSRRGAQTDHARSSRMAMCDCEQLWPPGGGASAPEPDELLFWTRRRLSESSDDSGFIRSGSPLCSARHTLHSRLAIPAYILCLVSKSWKTFYTY